MEELFKESCDEELVGGYDTPPGWSKWGDCEAVYSWVVFAWGR